MNNMFHRNELTVSKSCLFCISPERVHVGAESWMFFLSLLNCYSIYIIPLWEKLDQKKRTLFTQGILFPEKSRNFEHFLVC